MSLRVTDWKKVLDKPKNVGLKVVGTGISKALEKLDGAMRGHSKDALLPRYHIEITQAFAALNQQCDTVIKKHGKLFTEACTYLDQKVKPAAKASEAAFSKMRPKLENLYEVRAKLRDLLVKLKSANTGKDVKAVLNSIQKALNDGLKNTSKYTPFVNDFRNLREAAWEKAQSGAAIHASVEKTLKPAIAFTYSMDK